MVIHIVEDIGKKYCAGLDRKGTAITEIVIHATAGGGTLKWMIDGGDMGNGKSRAEEYKKGVGLFHFIIEKDGSISQIIDPKNWVYHSSSGIHDMETIGIELSKFKSNNSDEPTNEQYAALQELIDYLSNLYPSIKRLTSHDYNAKKYSCRDPKPCPGNFDWERVNV